MNENINNVCKIGQGNLCCRYLVVGNKGFECAKNTSLKEALDYRVYKQTIIAQGDNCEGKEPDELNRSIL